MLVPFPIMLCEGIDASLIVGSVASYLAHTGRSALPLGRRLMRPPASSRSERKSCSAADRLRPGNTLPAVGTVLAGVLGDDDAPSIGEVFVYLAPVLLLLLGSRPRSATAATA